MNELVEGDIATLDIKSDIQADVSKTKKTPKVDELK
jgi:hypothetical protein